MTLQKKLAILADAAKYAPSCARSGSMNKDSHKGKSIGSTSRGISIYHSYTPGGRCISLLKILPTNFCIYQCIYQCSYSINRALRPVERAWFTVDEVVDLTIKFTNVIILKGFFEFWDYSIIRLHHEIDGQYCAKTEEK
jgi:predicted DNA-binding helix-hairpin-helix protein